MENKDLNRLKVVLAEKKRTNKWLAEQLGKDPATVSKWCTNSAQPTEKTHQSPILRKLIVSRISFSMKFSSHPAISLFLPIGIFFSFLLSTAVTIFVIIE